MYFTQPMFSTQCQAVKNLVLNSDSLTHNTHGGKTWKLLLILYICLQIAQQWLMNHRTNRLQCIIPYMMNPNKCYLITNGKIIGKSLISDKSVRHWQ